MRRGKKVELKISTFIYYSVIIIFLEVIYKLVTNENSFFNIGLLYMPLFSISISCLLTFISRSFSPHINKILLWLTTLFICFIFGFQYIFVTLLAVPFSFHSLSLAHQAGDFTAIIFKTIYKHIFIIFLFLLPIILLIIIRKRITYENISNRVKLKYISLFFFIHSISILFLIPNQKKVYSSYKIYNYMDISNATNNHFGLLTGMRIDLRRMVISKNDDIILVSNLNSYDNDNDNSVEYGYNISDIDFEALITKTDDPTLNQMHNYFANEQATKKNEYTGIFKDKNLIFIIAEGFNQIAVDEELTPTLYKMANESFVFENFYTPMMFSTIGGEMQTLLGLIPFQETINLWHEQKTTFPYALGYSFQNVGYNAKSYHNWTYTYYSRDKTRPTIGFSDYLGKGNGLEKLMDCSTWPTSDVDLMEIVSSQIIGQDSKMLTYILTVSGHGDYTWGGNYISQKNRALVEHLPYSETTKAYLSAQIELDKALELLLNNLEESGELDNTVIAVVGDHYPYFLTIDEINEISTYERNKMELNHSSFILYNSQMPTTIVNKVSGQIDVLPTLLNLFDIAYDSRLIVGKDILSDTPGLVMFSEFNWITDLGIYDNGEFSHNQEKTVSSTYISTMEQIVANKFSISRLLIKTNYYQEIFK